MCPNLCSLAIQRPLIDSAVDSFFFYTRLGLLLKNIPTLRHLMLENVPKKAVPDELVAQVIKTLSSLESFEFDGYSQSTQLPSDQPTTSTFGAELTQLKHLSKLVLSSCTAVNATWCHQPWQAMLTHLTLSNCRNLLMIDAQKLIEQFGPTLTHLTLYLEDLDLPYEWAAENKFNLPALQNLDICAGGVHKLLESFRDCKALQYIRWNLLPSNEWTILERLVVSSSTWPNIKVLNFGEPEPHDPESWEINLATSKLRKFCHFNQIEFYGPDEDFW